MSSDLQRRAKAIEFVDEWKGTKDEQSESSVFHTDMFRMLMKCGPRDIKREITVHVMDGTSGRYDLLIPGKLLVEAKSKGKDLDAAYKRAMEYNTDPNVMVPYIMVDDFENFRLYSIEDKEEHRFTLNELPDKLHLFEFLIGADSVDDPEPIDIRVAYSMGRIVPASKIRSLFTRPWLLTWNCRANPSEVELMSFVCVAGTRLRATVV